MILANLASITQGTRDTGESSGQYHMDGPATAPKW